MRNTNEWKEDPAESTPCGKPLTIPGVDGFHSTLVSFKANMLLRIQHQKMKNHKSLVISLCFIIACLFSLVGQKLFSLSVINL